jgi:hypothetical protein
MSDALSGITLTPEEMGEALSDYLVKTGRLQAGEHLNGDLLSYYRVAVVQLEEITTLGVEKGEADAVHADESGGRIQPATEAVVPGADPADYSEVENKAGKGETGPAENIRE